MFRLLLFLSLIGCFAPALAQPSDEDTLRAFEAEVSRVMKLARVPGVAVAIVADGEIVLCRGYGTRTLGGDDPVDQDTLFSLGSVSKSMSAALAAMLVEQRTISWQDRVLDHLSEFRLHDASVTEEFLVEDIFCHRSGLPSRAGDIHSVMGLERDNSLRRLRYFAPAARFRRHYAYQNSLYNLAAALVEKVTDRSYEQVLKTELLEPLRMERSTASRREFQGDPNAAVPYIMVEETMYRRRDDSLEYLDQWQAAGGVYSCARDMTHYLNFFLQPSDSALRSNGYLLIPRTPMTPRKSYAMGWVVGGYGPVELVWHAGKSAGFQSSVVMLPSRKTGIAVLTNLENGRIAEHLAWRYFDELLSLPRVDRTSLQEPPLRAPVYPEGSLPPSRQLGLYTGEYHNPAYGTVVVGEDELGLTLTIGENKRSTLQIRHLNLDSFWLGKEGSRSLLVGPLEFELNSDGRPSALVIETFHKGRDGRFERTSWFDPGS